MKLQLGLDALSIYGLTLPRELAQREMRRPAWADGFEILLLVVQFRQSARVDGVGFEVPETGPTGLVCDHGIQQNNRVWIGPAYAFSDVLSCSRTKVVRVTNKDKSLWKAMDFPVQNLAYSDPASPEAGWRYPCARRRDTLPVQWKWMCLRMNTTVDAGTAPTFRQRGQQRCKRRDALLCTVPRETILPRNRWLGN